MELPGDGHVHSEWSWDTGGPSSSAVGRMEQTCARGARIGLRALAFTEHLDVRGWTIEPGDLLEHLRPLIGPDGVLVPPPLDVDGYRQAVERCRRRFPELRILTGVELGQPHLDGDAAAQSYDLSALDRINGSVHTLAHDGRRYEPVTLYRMWPPERVVEEYAAEIVRMVESPVAFDVVTHIDYAVRSWPTETAGPFDPRRFEDAFRHALRAVARSGRALEMNVGVNLRPWIPLWWSEEGGRAISFASDAHQPGQLANNFPEAVAMVEHHGFHRGRRTEDFWTRSSTSSGWSARST